MMDNLHCHAGEAHFRAFFEYGTFYGTVYGGEKTRWDRRDTHP